MERDLSRAFSDIALLFELSLSVSQSLDLETNCEQFLGRVMSRKNLAHAAMWIRGTSLPPELLPSAPADQEAFALVYSTPRRRNLPAVLPADYPAARRAQSSGPYSGALNSDSPSAFESPEGTDLGTIAVFPLGDFGILELGSLARANPMSNRELSRLATVIGGFAVSVKGCLDHLRMMSEMTARKQLDEQLRHAQKMEAVGQLAGGIAHDFNNLLVAIVGSAELLQRDGLNDTDRRDLAGDILTAAQRAANLTRQLLSFSRREQPVRELFDANQIVGEVARLLGRTIDRRIRLEVETTEGRAPVLGDGSELQNALLNLGLNARDAMPEGGQLTYRTRLASPDETSDTQLSEPVEPGRYLAIDVEDTGLGIPDTVRDRIFEPFFTTKELGRGTGLGLAAVYGIVRRHEGTLSVASTLGSGSRFTLLIPLAVDAPDTGPVRPHLENVVTGTGVVLIIDDEDTVRAMCARMLTWLGYETLVAADGEAGVEIFRKERARIDLVILDVMMPGMNGVETLSALRAIDSDVAVVISSGFGHQNDFEEADEIGVADTLHKPFSLGELSHTVARVVGARRAT